jgi:hypothetical protein
VLGRGRSLFEGIEKSDVQLLESRSFRNGLVLLRYKPA